MRLIASLTLACALALGGCATTDIAAFMSAAEEYDKHCFKEVTAQATPILIFGWPVPLFSGTYKKVCNPDQAGPSAPATPASPLTPGGVLTFQ